MLQISNYTRPRNTLDEKKKKEATIPKYNSYLMIEPLDNQ